MTGRVGVLFFPFLLAALARADTVVSGTITTTTWTEANSPYRVTGQITVPQGNTLTIEPGVTVLFDTYARIFVEGSIRAVGTETDSIVFMRGLSEHWGGIRITGGDSSAFAYVRLSDGFATVGPEYHEGGAVYLEGQARLSLTNCVLSGNQATRGGAICSGGILYLTGCTLSGNRCDLHGGALCVSGLTVLSNCTISGNSAKVGGGICGDVTATGCVFSENTGRVDGAAISGTGTFTDCTFRGNMTVEWLGWGGVVDGGGTFTRCQFVGNATERAPINTGGDSLCQVTLTSCTISGNRAGHSASALYVEADLDQTRGRPVIKLVNTVIAGNSCEWGSAVGGDHANVIIVNCTITGNSRSVDPRFHLPPEPPIGCAVGLTGESQATIVNSILWSNGGPEQFGTGVAVRYSDVMGGRDGEGNIDLDPLFGDSANGDFTLLPGSPCIDVGDPSLPADLDGSRADIGANPLLNPIVSVKERKRPDGFALEQNFPNPFNANTTIRFRLPEAGQISLMVYDVNGRVVRKLVNEYLLAGVHGVLWDGNDLTGRQMASGVYLYRLVTPSRTITRRTTLVR